MDILIRELILIREHILQVVLVTPVVRPAIANDKGEADENDVVEEGLFKGLKRMGDKTPFNQGDSNANPVQFLRKYLYNGVRKCARALTSESF